MKLIPKTTTKFVTKFRHSIYVFLKKRHPQPKFIYISDIVALIRTH